ncbi:MAG: methionine biosynthesis protein MetW [Myxococcales bacterium]|jgi:SAM-dependent methyltransferase
MSFALVAALFALLFALLALSLRALAATGVPVFASSEEAVRAALDLLDLKDGETLFDLGCGNGQVLRAARRRAKVRAFGYELNPFAFAVAALRSLFDRGVRVRPLDFRRARLHEADAVFLYLLPRAIERHIELFEDGLREGTRLVSVDFPVPGWTEAARREVGPLKQPVRLYIVGEHRRPAPWAPTIDGRGTNVPGTAVL